MSYLLALLSGLADFIQWAIGYGQRRIGQDEQKAADAEDLNAALKTELDAANKHTDALEQLHDGKF